MNGKVLSMLVVDVEKLFADPQCYGCSAWTWCDRKRPWVPFGPGLSCDQCLLCILSLLGSKTASEGKWDARTSRFRGK